ncbi:hypothetical protein RRG08_013136 [Elysia crispata]|uniref:Uncharacterized protein n=1 Tax=Elysia crispata TaxID=231223 RepID=A0AAE1A231_9GAST|nr:hypothetical protein RRG08_013136 [Elysia crispata]
MSHLLAIFTIRRNLRGNPGASERESPLRKRRPNFHAAMTPERYFFDFQRFQESGSRRIREIQQHAKLLMEDANSIEKNDTAIALSVPKA